jgi:hypothetical protein
LFWQPTPSGKVVLQHFLRMKLAGHLMDGQAKGAIRGLRTDLAQGESVEVAGYQLLPALASGLEQATLDPPSTPGRMEWLELSTQDGPTPLSAVASATLARWQHAGWTLRSAVVKGPSFWHTAEIEEVPNLIRATLSALPDLVPT